MRNKKNIARKEITEKIYAETGYPLATVQDVVGRTVDIIRNALSSGQDVEFRGLGALRITIRKARIGRDPRKPEIEVVIPTRASVRFKPGKELKEQLKRLDISKYDIRNMGK